MNFTEQLNWILDKNGKSLNRESEYRENIEFVHSLGLKCDCVGWSSLDLSDARADEILEAIREFCRKEGCNARGVYTRTYTDVQSDWYEIAAPKPRDNAWVCNEFILSENGEKVPVAVLRAFQESPATPKDAYGNLLFPERLRNACIRHNIPDVEFCWAQDKGKYAAEQYFQVYAKNLIGHVARARKLSVENRSGLEAAGGSLPKLANIFYNLQFIHLPSCYLAQDLPESGIAYVYLPRTYSDCGADTVLIHKDTAQLLLHEKVISPSVLRPAPVIQTLPGGYTLDPTQPKPRPTNAYIQQMLASYEALKAKPRPVRQITEKDAVKALRLAKRERKEDFRKPIRKTALPLTEEAYAPLLPYYQVSDGGYLSEEYELLSYPQAVEQNQQFFCRLAAEELLEERPKGVVVAGCADGDSVLLCPDGTVIRFNHEEPVVTAQWSSLAQFIADVLEQ